MHIIVIGAGLGGIAASARLAKAGHQVTVFEKAATPGGRVSLLQKDGYRFDVGPTLLLMPDIFRETYAALGENMDDHLDLIRIDPSYRAHFHGNSTLDLTADLPTMHACLEALEPGSFGRFLQFMAEGHTHYDLSLKNFVGRNYSSYLEYFALKNIPLLFKMKALLKHARYTSRFFKDPRLQAVFSFQNMYLGLSPYNAPATFSLLQYTELADGVWFPRGGLFRPIATLESIARSLGVRFEYDSPVQRIDIAANRATGVTLADGRHVPADLVVANADLPYVYASLLPPDGSAARLARKQYTSSALMFYWAINGPRPVQLLHHNVFLADHQYRSSFDSIFKDLSLPANPSFYVNAPTRTDPTFAPPDGDALMVLVPTGHIDPNHPQDWPALRDRARDYVLNQLTAIGIPDLRQRILFEETLGPPQYQHGLNLANGAAFGLSHNFTQVGYLRPHNRHPRYPNLYFTGASTHPGTGLPMVLLSARLTAERILQDLA